jgi:hypothetical protein
MLSDKQGSNVWGYKFDSRILFLDAKNEHVYTNEPTYRPKEKTYKNVFISTLDSQLSVTHPILEFEDKKWVVVDLPIKHDRIELMEYIAHETFHLIQSKLKIPTSNPSLPHLSTIKGRTLIHVEIIELVKALKESQAQLRNAHIKNALALRAKRYAQFDDAEELEDKCEMNEGLAEYTGRKYAGYTEEQLFEEYERDIGVLESIANEAAYPYVSGSLYAFLNDLSGKEWKNQLPEKSVSQIATSLYKIVLKENYMYLTDSLLNQNGYKEISSKFTNVSLEGSGLMFSKNLLIIPAKGSQYQFKSNIVVSIPNQGTVYNNVIINNEWGRLEVDKDGRVLISDNIKLPTESFSISEKLIKGNHWVLTMKPQWEVINNNGEYILQKHN